MTAQNSKQTRGRPFPKGRSGNPGGRPKGLGDLVRKRCGADGKLIIDALLAVAFGKAKELAQLEWEIPSNKERLEALDMLLNRGWGKAPQAVEIGAIGGGPLKVEVVFVDAGSD